MSDGEGQKLLERVTAGVQLFVVLIKNLPRIIVEIVKAVPLIAECGLNLIKGLWDGKIDAGAWLRDKISGFFGGVVDKIKDFLDIHSPSALLHDTRRNKGDTQ